MDVRALNKCYLSCIAAGVAVLLCFNNPIDKPIQFVEICDNALDDDGDQLIDLNDPDCECTIIDPISRIPNPSFEETNCCPYNRSQLHCANGWIQASEPTTDLIHDCGSWQGWGEFPPPKPYPQGKGIMGFRDGRRIRGGNTQEYNWKEYAGACLTAPLLAGETYRFEFYIGFVNSTVSPDIDVTFFGTTSCDYLPFGVGNQELGCPTNGPNWKKLSNVRVTGNSGWEKTGLVVVPNQDIYAIAIGPPCSQTTASVSTYYFLDDLVLDDIDNFELVISEESHPCSDNFIISVPERNSYEYQWYKEGVALLGETNNTLENVDEGEGYQLRLIRDGECRVTNVFNYSKPVIENNLTVKICDGTSFEFDNNVLTESGNYDASFISKDGCDSIVYLFIEGLSTIRDTVHAKVFPGDNYNYGNLSFNEVGENIEALIDEDGCDLFLHVFLEHFQVYAPNVFSPNGDGNNDYFNITGGPDLIEVKSMSIYDRWGGQVFHRENILPGEGEVDSGGWDGGISSGIVGSGVYVYAVRVLMENGLEKTLYGSVLLVR